jgi:hypothetical protein
MSLCWVDVMILRSVNGLTGLARPRTKPALTPVCEMPSTASDYTTTPVAVRNTGSACTLVGIAEILRRASSGSHCAAEPHSVRRALAISTLGGAAQQPTTSVRRTLIIKNPPTGVRFSHPFAEEPQGTTAVQPETASENIFREPDFAPGTLAADADEPETGQPAPVDVDVEATSRRRARRRSAA